MTKFESKRSFQLWAYSVSHRMLLIRSPSDETNEANIDLVFGGVTNVELVTSKIHGLSLQERATDEEESIFELRSEGVEGIVVASIFKSYENKLDLFDTGLDVNPG